MNIKIKKKVLENTLSKISRAISSNPILTSLKGIKIFIENEKIIFLASNGLLSIKEFLKIDNENVKVNSPETILVPGKTFIEIIKKQSNEINIETFEKTMEIFSENSSVKINLLQTEDFPKIDFDILGEELIINIDDFRKKIKDVSFAASENDKRILLNGINLIAKNNKLRISATDSFRLATTKMNIISNNNFNITIISKNLKDFIPSSIEGEVKIKVDENKINLKHETTLLQSRLVDGIYPDLVNLIPKEYNFNLKIKTKILLDLIDKAIVIYSSDLKTVKLSIENKKLFIESKSKEIGNTKISTEEFEWNGDDFEISFDSKFLKDALRQFKDEIEIRFINNLKPFIIISKSKENLVQLILPYRGY
ncbi:MAG: DNA polymerase III subunit beta [Mycoplasma sp.]|nr:DNA polymerase III subunit beta [Mycoplasma sp.]